MTKKIKQQLASCRLLKLVQIVTCVLSLGLSSAVWAEPENWRAVYASNAAQATLHPVELAKDYALGINRFDLDSHTEILGWQLSHSFYFGRQSGEDSGLTLVWQQSTNQVSLSKDGLRLTRRF